MKSKTKTTYIGFKCAPEQKEQIISKCRKYGLSMSCLLYTSRYFPMNQNKLKIIETIDKMQKMCIRDRSSAHMSYLRHHRRFRPASGGSP